MSSESPQPVAAPAVLGLLAEFDSPGALLTAAEALRDAGYTRWDAHSPYPVHGIDEAMGIRPTRLPWVVAGLGAAGTAGGFLLVWWANATGAKQFEGVPSWLQGYPFITSGKPLLSLPAFIPVMFEVTVLLAAIAAVIAMLAMNGLPWHHNPLLASARFRRVTRDRFFVHVAAADPRFEAGATEALLRGLGAGAVEAVRDVGATESGSAGASPSPARLPRGFVIGGMIVAALALLPPLLIAKARLALSSEPRIHIIQDMDNQPRFHAQQANPAFADGRASRLPVAGTLARGDLRADAWFHEGRLPGKGAARAAPAATAPSTQATDGEAWAKTFPPQVELSEAFVRRGQERYNIYCAPCHGADGGGNGIVNVRAQAFVAGATRSGWVQPTNLHDALIVQERELGHLFNTIANGIRSMPPYGDQIPAADRWAILAYVRALQLSQAARLEDVPEEVRPELR